jgi:hypothetical protein
MPIVFAIPVSPFLVGLLRKSKPDGIKPVALVVGGLLLLGAVPAAAAPVPPPRLVRIATDATSTQAAQHATIVEPDAVAVGSRVVATFQVGRYFGGSAGAIGFATSGDGGRTWRSGLLPGITQATSPPGPSNAASDPTVAWDARHGRWLIATLVNTDDQSALFVNGSADGLTWDGPTTAISYTPERNGEGTAVDKEWITCDNRARSPFLGRCYLAYTDLAHDAPRQEGGNIGVQSTTDGGLTWSQPVLLPVDANSVSPGVQPVVRPNGELVIVFFEDGVVQAVRSNDGGATFAPPERIAALTFHRRPATRTRLRGFSLPTATVDLAGAVYAAWPDCRFRANCPADDIVWSRSTAPGRWTRPRRVPLGQLGRREFTLPDLAVDPASRGGRTRLALTYYRLNNADCTETNCLLDFFLVTSRTAGSRWTRPRKINPHTMRLTWIAQTSSGRMVGDYTGTVFSGKRVVSIHVQARAPRGGTFNEAAFAYVLTLP